MNWLIAGLGNSPDKYHKTRHNAGFWLVDQLANQFNVNFQNHKLSALSCQIQIASENIRLIKPNQFMNNSGISVAEFLHYYRINSDHLIVCHDELDFAAGIVKFKQGGSAAGHNGISDIIRSLGTNDFLRLRIGIGKPMQLKSITNYVLVEPPSEQKQKIDIAITTAIEAINLLFNKDLQQAMLFLHSKNNQ